MSSPVRPGAAAPAVAAVVLGVVVAACGTLVHRWEVASLPGGVILALVAVMLGAVVARALADGGGVALYALAAILTSQTMTFFGPGGDVLVTGGLLSNVWLLGVPVAAAAAAVTPRSWYAGAPAVPARHSGAQHLGDV
ncbi:hypothetical protein [Georgenia yuyongxinii]|uniref:Uncharacterized protein n=1 Tax=Georgenia yuyongxinii TaxID=2589797 RepID=A0A552WPG3_9MICO|nr:hypothetical protein [Georgenia yuyongxinii]TRW44672.1 hypothetical protein FJ693_12595 [Georgenia yuyongxinii]